MFCLAVAAAEAASPSLKALSAPGLDLDGAWIDRDGWSAAPKAILRGVNDSDTPVAEVRARWNPAAVFFEFLCRDESLVSPGDSDGLDHFKVGDVAEIFLGRRGKPFYLEVHATPAGRKTVYAFRAYRKASAVPGGSEIRAGKIDGGWRAVLAIPWSALGEGPEDGPWEFLAGRYDYDEEGGQARLSSFPAQTGKPDFHQRGGYARLELQP